MKVKIILAGLILLSGLVCAIFLIPPGGDNTPSSSPTTAKASHQENRVRDSGETHANQRKRTSSRDKPNDPRLNSLFSGDRYEFSSQRLEDYLNSVGRGDKSLAAAFLLSKDERFLYELRNYADSESAASMLARYDSNMKSRKEAANVLIRLNPNSPKGFYLLSLIQAKEGDPVGAVDQLQKALALPGTLDVEDEGIKNSTLDALKFLGLDNVRSQAYLLSNPGPIEAFARESDTLTKSVADSLPNLSEEEQAQRASILVGLFLRSGDLTTANSGLSVISQMANQSTILKRLPADLGYGEKETVTERLKELNTQIKDQVKIEYEQVDALRKADPAVVDTYFDIMRNDGIINARSWLLGNQR